MLKSSTVDWYLTLVRQQAGALESGKTVGIVAGPYEGDSGVVLDVIGTSVSVQLENLGRRADQPQRFVVVLDSEEGFRKFHREHPLKQPKADKSGLTAIPRGDNSMGSRGHKGGSREQTHRDRDRDRSKHDKKRKRDKHSKHDKHHKSSRSEKSSSSSSRLWIRENIRVRIVSKKVGRDRNIIKCVRDLIYDNCNVDWGRSIL